MYRNDSEFIKSIPKIITENNEITKEFIIEKLLEANNNDNIVMLARGDGRNFWRRYIKNGDFFEWGYKSEHAYKEEPYYRILRNRFTDEKLRDLLNPYYYSEELLRELIDQVVFSLNNHKDRLSIKEEYILNFEYRMKRIIKAENIVNNIKLAVDNLECEEDMIYLKFALCGLLHSMGNPIYKGRSIYISTAQGVSRYRIAKSYGRWKGFISERYKTSKSDENKKRFIILDYWVSRDENREQYFIKQEFLDILKKYNIEWYNDRDNEVLLKYVMFPHQIIGYYYFEDDELMHYRVNPYYLKKWEEDKNFRIGEHVNIPQNIENIGDEFPFDRIYTKCEEFYISRV